MKIVVHNTQSNSKIDNKTLLGESFVRLGNKDAFMNENAHIPGAEEFYAVEALKESLTSRRQFVFENGMSIPGLGTLTRGRLSLNEISESAKTPEEFVSIVDSHICEAHLNFRMSEKDKSNLVEAFNEHKNKQKL